MGTRFFLGEKVPFSRAFPQIEKVDVRVRISEWPSEKTTPHYYTQHNLGEYIDCINPRCYKGGFRIGDDLRRMVAQRQEEFSGSASCQGYEGSPKGRRKYGPCDMQFEYTIKVTYKDQTSTPPA
jgi:hypothetical protein